MNKVCLVTGAKKGIGLAVSKKMIDDILLVLIFFIFLIPFLRYYTNRQDKE